MNNNCLRTQSMDNTLLYLFYTNVKITMHSKNVFQNTLCETFAFLACDVHTETCPFHFKLSNLPSQTTGLHYEILVKKKLLMELCARNYETSNGLVNGANGIFEDFIESISKSFVWIHFHNPQIGHNA